MAPNILAALAALVTFIFILDLLRRGVLKEKYAVLWLFFAGAAMLLALFPQVLDWISFRLGVAQPVNLLFFITIVLLVLVSVQLSYELSRHEARIRRLAEEIALLNKRISDVEEDSQEQRDGQ